MICFRADANSTIGIGHIMRCLSIADAFRNYGYADIVFVLADHSVEELINDRGYEAIVLNSPFNNMDDEPLLWEGVDLSSIDFLVVDSYYVTEGYLSSLREGLHHHTSGYGKLVYIDDVAAFPYPVDVLVNYNIYSELFTYENLYANSDDHPEFILGTKYVPLRSMFRDVPDKEQNEVAGNILFSTGGSDELHLALALMERLGSYRSDDVAYHFLIGAMNTDKEKIRGLAATSELSDCVVIHENVSDMRKLIRSMDMVVSAAGSTLYEICSCGVPLITFSLADNQLPGASGFVSHGLAVDIGDLRDSSTIVPGAVMSGKLDPSAVDRIFAAEKALSDNYELRVDMGQKMQSMIDGRGADRLVEKLTTLLTGKHGLLQRIIVQYLFSNDYNGLPKYAVEKSDYGFAKELINQGQIEALYDILNPHIKRFDNTSSVEEQMDNLNRDDSEVCFYPTPLSLKAIPKDDTKPYTKMLQSGCGQFEVVYFDVEVLEQYFNDPKYSIYDIGYRGSIVSRDEYENGDYIKDYGMAYPKDDGAEIDRAIAIFVCDLAHLSEKSQMKWKSREIDDQDAWLVNGGFVKNLVFGQWVEHIWVYSALLKEMEIINQMCDAIGIPHIFIRTWRVDNNYSRPDGFRTILSPTRKNYYEFVNVLEKMVCNNISIKAFTCVNPYVISVIHEEKDGSLSVLGKWLKENGWSDQTVDDCIIAPLKRLRNIRQTPAHRIIENEYDKEVYKDQNQLINDVYGAIRTLRIVMGRHPMAKGVEVPEYLEDEERIVIY